MVDILMRVALFFSLLNHKSPVTMTTCTVMVWVRTARKTCAVTAHLSFICGWPKPPRGMRFPWPHGKLFMWMHKVQTALQIYNTIFIPLQIYTQLINKSFTLEFTFILSQNPPVLVYFQAHTHKTCNVKQKFLHFCPF